jgi:uncharacterized damage-inducible protein DinB
MEDAFSHHAWATLRLVDACLALSPEQLETTVPGTYGSILDTLRHSIASDAWDLFVATGDRALELLDVSWEGGVHESGVAWVVSAAIAAGERFDTAAFERTMMASAGQQGVPK